MKGAFGKPGIFRFVFVALLLVFNWPVLSIPAPAALFGWLFTVWGLAIALLFLAACGAASSNGSAEPPGPEPSRTGQHGTGPDAGGGHV
ncbi:MAG: hypothetical protein Q7U56_13885 [Humidesulfovibrio sp.]|nr:hypothetical protein [Desulfovibrio sp.]MDO9084362.1 hypothetical protein [Humidesulfovibrio sp.]